MKLFTSLFSFISIFSLLDPVSGVFNGESNKIGCVERTSFSGNAKAYYYTSDISTTQFGVLTKLQTYQQDFRSNALAVLSSLQIPETCIYSALTESLIEKCSTSLDSMEGAEKIKFATKLAVCEFKVADVDYPRECNDKLHENWEIKRCVRKLEGRPQWWTSWSNCLQNIGIICQAVRHEAEQDSLLRLHRNLTNLQTKLQTHLYDALQETEMLKHNNREYASQFSTSMNNLGEEFKRVKESMFEGVVDLFSRFKASFIDSQDVLSAGTENFMEKISQVTAEIEHQHIHAKGLSDKLKQLSTDLYEDYDLFKRLEKSKHEDAVGRFVETQSLLRSVVEASEHNIEQLSRMTMDKMRQTQQTLDDIRTSASISHDILQGLNNDTTSLKLSQEFLQSGLVDIQHFQNKQLITFTEYAVLLNDTLDSFLTKAEMVMCRLEHAEQRIEELAFNNNSSLIWVTIPLLLCGVALVNKRLLGYMFVFGSALLWLWVVLHHGNTTDAVQQYLVESPIPINFTISRLLAIVFGKVSIPYEMHHTVVEDS